MVVGGNDLFDEAIEGHAVDLGVGCVEGFDISVVVVWVIALVGVVFFAGGVFRVLFCDE